MSKVESFKNFRNPQLGVVAEIILKALEGGPEDLVLSGRREDTVHLIRCCENLPESGCIGNGPSHLAGYRKVTHLSPDVAIELEVRDADRSGRKKWTYDIYFRRRLLDGREILPGQYPWGSTSSGANFTI